MKRIASLSLEEYDYQLPEERIALNGLDDRSDAKLLVYDHGVIQHSIFNRLSSYLPGQSTLFFNNSKVIPARLLFRKNTGALVEIFLLQPSRNDDVAKALSTTGTTTWDCMIGNLKKWTEGLTLTESLQINGQKIMVSARLASREEQQVVFSWHSSKISFSEIIDAFGHTPLPPYIHRRDVPQDRVDYQTVYCEVPGAVAAPTAGLHFTDDLLRQLRLSGYQQEFLTLLVGAGTFKPIQSPKVLDHPMHMERVLISYENVMAMRDASRVIPVGTTSLRSLESTYWFGVKLLDNPDSIFSIQKLDPYTVRSSLPSRKVALTAVIDYMQRKQLNILSGDTSLFIVPGYHFQLTDGLITNFHLPKSSLILLIASLVGPKWRDIYTSALEHEYRFLSFGDASLLLPGKVTSP